jgi:protein disulfide-isomerase
MDDRAHGAQSKLTVSDTLVRGLESNMLNQATILLAVLPALSPSPQPYDERADARVEVARMLQCARAEQKPVLLMFGANWCPWCRELDRMLASDRELSTLADNVFLRMNVDIGQYDRNLTLAAEYGLTNLDDTGIPMLVVLSPDGSVQAVKNSEDFVVGSKYARGAVQRFLRSYARH